MTLAVNFDKDFLDAANYVLKEHLSKTYRDGTGDGGRERGVERDYIDRPLHGLVHAMRKAAYAPVYFHLLKEKKYKGTDKLDDAELKKIMIALLFQVSGRQSEYNDGGKREQYREAGAQNFEKFAKEHMSHLFTAEDIKKYRAIIAEPRHNPYQNSVEMKIMRQIHALELIRLQDKAVEMFYMSDDYNGIAGGIQRQFDAQSAVNYMNYITDLYQATGDGLHEFDIGPGKKFSSPSLGDRTYPPQTPVFKKATINANLARFEKCQYSAEECLKQILSVPPPFGIQYRADNIKASKSKLPEKQVGVPNKKTQEKLNELKQEEEKLKREIDEINGMLQLGELGGQKKILDEQVSTLQKKLEIIQGQKKELGAIPEYNWRSGNYEVKATNILCGDGVVRDEVRIPGDNNCCYNAALVAAKHAGALPDNIQNHYQLRMAVANRMREELRLHPDDEEGDFAAAIEGYNREFRAHIETFEEYIKEVERLETWGGEYELAIIAKILNVNIVDHSDRQPEPFVIETNRSRPTLHVHHTGAHYNFYVNPGSWQGLPEADPIRVFDQGYNDFKYKLYKKRLESFKKQASEKGKNIPKESSSGIPITYDNYFTLSKDLKKLEIDIQLTTNALKTDNLQKEKKIQLQKNLMKHTAQHSKLSKTIEEFRRTLWIDPDFVDSLKKHYKSLTEEYLVRTQLLYVLFQDLQNLQDQKIKVLSLHGAASQQYQAIQQEIDKKQGDFDRNQQSYQEGFDKLNEEMEFIVREIPNIEQRAQEMAKLNSLKANIKGLSLKINDKPQAKTEAVALTHLKNFLGERYKEGLSLDQMIDLYFNDPNVRAMLFISYKTALQLGERCEPIFIDSPGDAQTLENLVAQMPLERAFTEGKGAIYDPKYVEHFKAQLKRMVEAEMEHGERFALYNSLSGGLSVGNDVIRQLNAMLFAQDQSLFRLFSDNFEFKNGEDFRKDVFDTKKVDDTNPEFLVRGLCCGLSPFQITQNENPLDFWVRGVNLNKFDRWEKEILPKIKLMTDDKMLIADLTRDYSDLVALSGKLGSRMTQFLLTPEDIDQYAWISGGFGYQMPSVKENGDKTTKLSDALSFYEKAPNEFLQSHKVSRDQFFQHTDLTKNQQNKAYDPTYNSTQEERRSLAQLQGRLYLHPELFTPGRSQINTYFSLPPDQKLLDDYNNRVKIFAEKVGALLIKAKLEGKFQEPAKNINVELPSHDLSQSIIALRPYKYAESDKLKPAFDLIRELAKAGISKVPPLPQNQFYDVQIRNKNFSEIQKHLDDLHEPVRITEALSVCFYCAIAHGDKDTFEHLLKYYQMHLSKSLPPINFDKLSDQKSENTALIIAAKFNQSEMIGRLLELRDTYNVRRTVQESGSLNSPLHYLAEHGNLDAFKMLAISLRNKRSWTSFVYYIANSVNKEQNTPLHVLAINELPLTEDRLKILEFLFSNKNVDLFNQLIGIDAITTPNSNGLSPIMIAALTQNIEAVTLLAKKAKLSKNQHRLYLWLAQDPINRLPQIQGNLQLYGNIPGFVSSTWVIPEGFKGKIEPDAQMVSFNPALNIDELKKVFTDALSATDKTELTAFDELASALGPAINDYISGLVYELTTRGAASELEKLSIIIRERNIKINHAVNDESPLLNAARAGEMTTVLQLLSSKEELKIQRTKTDNTGMSALHYLATHDHSDEAIIALLTKRTWSSSLGGMAFSSFEPTTIQNNEGDNPVHILARLGKTATLKAIDAAFTTKSTMLWSGSSGLYTQLYNASWQQNKQGKTPIMVAVLENPTNEEAIKCLATAMNLATEDTNQYLLLARAIAQGQEQTINQQLKNLEKVKSWNQSFNSYAKVQEAIRLGIQRKKIAIK